MREIPRKKREGNEREYPIKKVERRNPGACVYRLRKRFCFFVPRIEEFLGDRTEIREKARGII